MYAGRSPVTRGYGIGRSTVSQGIIDHEIVRELQEVMGDDFGMLVNSFLRDGENRLQRLANAIEAGDEEQVRRLAHSFKGSSSNLGVAPLADLCLEMERAGREADLDRAGTLLERARTVFGDAGDQLRNMVGEE